MKTTRRKARKLCRDLPGHSLPATEIQLHTQRRAHRLLYCSAYKRNPPTQEDTHPPGVSAHLDRPETPVSFPASRLTMLHPYFLTSHYNSLVNKNLVFSLGLWKIVGHIFGNQNAQ